MNHSIKNKIYSVAILLLFITLGGCTKYLDREPLSDVTPGVFFSNEADLAAYTINQYAFPSHGGWGPGLFGNDNHTDNQATGSYATRWVPGEYRVPQSGGNWDFGGIRSANYFLETVVPKWKNGEISGNAGSIDHYIGEGYFLRAYQYFNKIQAFGDFPILKNTLPDEQEVLKEASKRRPRNEVARFVLADLDSAIMLLRDVAPQGGKNRISKNAALLFKSRVALHEATWLTYHKGTAQVPGGPDWPGTGKVEGFNINIDQEIDFFLTQAMEASAKVADAVPLVENLKDNGYDSSKNPYAMMFADQNLDPYSEVLLWRAYNSSEGITHNVNHYINQNGGNTGYTRGFVDNFLMANGLPIYAGGSGYHGDDYISDVKEDRDNRLQLFMKAPGELRLTDQVSDGEPILIGNPDIVGLPETRDVTGYSIKKGFSYLSSQDEGSSGTTGSIVFRAVEAYLNYIEASYLKNGAIDAKADAYWKAIRARAGVNSDYNITINATNMTEEAKNDFAAYSAGQLLTDKTLYNIRRERRSEFIAEGMRYADLKRWRALDQLANNPYIIEGFKVFGPMQEWYENLVEQGTSGQTANISSSKESDYLRPYRVILNASNFVQDGYRWTPAHYLEPIAMEHFIITSETPGNVSTSVIYQNPGWPLQANEGAE